MKSPSTADYIALSRELEQLQKKALAEYGVQLDSEVPF
jgi:hypothetical protein